MTGCITRRDLIAGAAAGTLAWSGLGRAARAEGKPGITGVTWGGTWINAWKPIAARQSAVDIDWMLHEAVTTAIIAKIKASWPNPIADFIDASEPTQYSMAREGWLEPLTQEAIPNMAHLPPDQFIRDPEGRIVTVPVGNTMSFWAYNEAAIGMKIEKPEDLLSPKLSGKLMLNLPTIASGCQIITLARARGGDERNMDPGFGFVKDLVKAKAVGAVVKTDVQIVNAFTTGEVAIGFINTGNYHEISKHVKLTLLNRVPGSPTFGTFTGFESVAVLKKPGDRKPVFDFINFCLEPDNNTAYAAAIGTIPTNERAQASPELDPLRLHNEAERKAFGIPIDRAFISTQTDAWNRTWELEIGPLL